MSTLNRQVNRAFVPLLEPARRKGAFGGRASGKSHHFAEDAVETGVVFPGDWGEGARIVCVREVQKDLKESAKALIEKKIRQFGLTEQDGFKIYRDEIALPKDGLIIFRGMQNYNSDSIKSLEGFHRAWVEEAHTLSKTSLNLLTPTIRGDNSEIWFSWNPRMKTDAVDEYLRSDEKPQGSVVVNVNWRDNAFFTEESEMERQDCLRMTPDQYPHIWDGEYVTIIEGAYYAQHLSQAKDDGRVSNVGKDPLLINRLFADIGGTGARSDNFVFWLAQFVGREIRTLDHYEVQGQEIGHHLNWMRSKNLEPDNTKIWLPHDGDTNDKVYDISYASAFKQAGYPVEVIPNQGRGAAMARIESGRRVFPQVWFNQDTTEAGRSALGWYHEKKDEVRGIGLGPDHDWASHSADAFGLMAIVYEKHLKESGKTQADPYKDWEDYG